MPRGLKLIAVVVLSGITRTSAAQVATLPNWHAGIVLQASAPKLPSFGAGLAVSRRLVSIESVEVDASAAVFAALANGARVVCTGAGDCDSRLINRVGAMTADVKLPLASWDNTTTAKLVVSGGGFASQLDAYGYDRSGAGPSSLLLSAGVEFSERAAPFRSVLIGASNYGSIGTAFFARASVGW